MTTEHVDIVVSERGTGAHRIADGFRRVGNESGKAVSPVKALTAAVGAATVALGARAIVSTLREYSQEMSTVKALTKASASEFTQLDRVAKQLGATTRFSASQAAEGMAFLARAGFETNEVLTSIEGTLFLAQSGALELGEAADIASNILTGFRLEAGQTARVVDVLALAANSSNTTVSQLGQGMKFVAPIAAALNVSLEDTTAAIGALSDSGLQAGLAGRGLRSVLANLEAPSSDAEEILDELGLTADDVRVSSVGLTEAIGALADKNITTGQSLKFFGREAGAAFEVLQAAGGDLDEFSDKLDKADGTAQKISKTMDDNLNGAALGLRSAVEGLILKIGELGAESALTTFVKTLTAGVRALTNNLDKAVPVINAVAAGLLAMGAQAILASLGGVTLSVGALTGAVARLSAVALANPLILFAAATAGLLTVIGRATDVTRKLEGAQSSYNAALATADTALDTYRKGVEDTATAVEDLSTAQLIIAREELTKSIEVQTKALAAHKKVIGRTAQEYKGLIHFFTNDAVIYQWSDAVGEVSEAFKRGELDAESYIEKLNEFVTADGGGDPSARRLLEKIAEYGSTSEAEQNLATLQQRLEDIKIFLAGGIPTKKVVEDLDDAGAATEELTTALDKLAKFERDAKDTTTTELQKEIAAITATRDDVVAALVEVGKTGAELDRARAAAQTLIDDARQDAAKPADTSAQDRIIAATKSLRDNVAVMKEAAGVEREITRNLIAAGLTAADRTTEQGKAIVEYTQQLYTLTEAEKEVKKEKDKAVKTYADYTREIEQQTALLDVESESRDAVSRAIAIENELLRSKIVLTSEERLELADKLHLLNELQQIDNAELAIKSELITYNRDLVYEMAALNNLYNEGTLSVEQYKNQVEDLGLKALEAQIAAGEGNFADGFLAELGRMSQGAENFKSRAGASFGQFFTSFSKGAADSFGRAIAFGDDLGKSLENVARNAVAQLISSLIQMGIQFVINAAIGQSLAVAATGASTAQAALLASAWAPAAAFASLATLGANAAPASAAVVGTVALSEGIGAAASAFADGGPVYGPGGPREDKVPAWLSNGEYVINAGSTDKYRPWVEAINEDRGMGALRSLSANHGGAGGLSSGGTTSSVGGRTLVMPVTMALTYAPQNANDKDADQTFLEQFTEEAETALGDIVRRVLVEEQDSGGVLSR